MKRIICIILIVLTVLIGLFVIADVIIYSLLEEPYTIEAVAAGDWVETSSGRIFFRQAGSGEVVVLVHGFLSSSRDFDQLFELLRKQYHVIACDLNSFGLSVPYIDADLSKAGLASTLWEALDTLTSDEVFIIGHSMGGEVALHAALQRPESIEGMLLLAPSGARAVDAPNVPTLFINSLFKHYLIQRSLFQGSYHEPDSEAKERFERQYVLNKAIPGEYLSRFNEADDSAEVFDSLERLQVPVLLVAGSEDTIIPVSDVKGLAGQIPSGDLTILEGVGHAIQNEVPEKVVELFEDFIERLSVK